MTSPISISDLLSRFQSLIGDQQNIPQTLPIQPDDCNRKTVSPLPLHAIPALPTASSTIPSTSKSLEDLTAYLTTHILPNLNGSSLSPNYYGFVTGGVTPAALLADWLVSIYDQNVQVHLPIETISTIVEVAALNQLVDLFHLPKHAWAIGTSGAGGGGTFTTGATASNVLGLAIGREYVVQRRVKAEGSHAGTAGVISSSVADLGLLEATRRADLHALKVLSTLPHSSIGKAASVVGIGRSQVISVIKPGTDLEIDLAAIEKHASEPHTACILVISAGEVNTGHFDTSSGDTWQRLRQLSDRYGMWIHVDGAFGLFARILRNEPTSTDADTDYTSIVCAVQNLDLADSITGDAHKLLNVPYDCGFFFTRHKKLSEQVFQNAGAAYLSAPPVKSSVEQNETEEMVYGDAIQSPLNIGLENSRRFRALPVHATLMAYGRSGHVEMLKRQIALARRVTRWLWACEGAVVLPAQEDKSGKAGSKDSEAALDEAVRKTFMVVLFRAKDEGLNTVLAKKINASGKMYVTGTKWNGKPAVRMAVSNWMVNVQRDGERVEGVLSEVFAM